MTLTKILQLNEKYLRYADLRALDYCERRYKEAGEPTERWPLFNFLEKMLQELQRSGIGYPKVLLLRKKKIQNGIFAIPQAGEENVEEACSCFDRWLLSGAPCHCPKGEPHRQMLRKWGMQI